MRILRRPAVVAAVTATLLTAGLSTAQAAPTAATAATPPAGSAAAPLAPPLGEASLADDIFPGFVYYTPAWLQSYAGELYFASRTAGHPKEPGVAGQADDEVPPPGLWAYDAVTDTSRLISAFAPDPAELTVFDGRLFFTASDGGAVERLWSYDAATQQLRQESSPAYPAGLVEYAGRLYFSAIDRAHGQELWSYDPATRTSSLAADILPGEGSSAPGQYLGAPTVYAGRLYFSAIGDTAYGTELWSFDAATGRAALAADIRRGPESSYPATPAVYAGRLYLSAEDGTKGRELWAYDAATSAATLVSDLEDGPGGSDPGFIEGFTVYDGRLLFGAEQTGHGHELYGYDATAGEVALVAELSAGRRDSAPGGLTEYAGRLYFFAVGDGQTDFVLYAYDPGTDVATLAANAVACTYAPRDLEVYAGELYFCGYDAAHGEELWRYVAAGELGVTFDAGATPVVVGPAGGTVTAELTVTNYAGRERTLQLWTDAVTQDRTVIGPLAGPRTITLAAGETFGPVRVRQVVPAAAPAGGYLYRVSVGTFPDAVLATAGVTVTKSPGSATGDVTADWPSGELAPTG